MAPIEAASAEDYRSPLDSSSEHDQDKKKEDPKGKIDENKLTVDEVQQLKNGQTSIKKLVAEREQLKRTAEVELNAFVKQEDVIDLKDYKQFKKEIEETESPDKMQEIIDRIRELPQKKAKDEKERDLDDPEILKLDKRFKKICADNDHLIHDKKEYEDWWQEEKEKNPTLKYLNDLLERFEGKNSTDKNGLHPRRQEYNEITALYKKYG
ncbi:hypothetical protein HY605_00385, partial [Candidatus Peregrinibacteria bacterium]|nr:hypothetical protein [Candidatus Peregrinibacteria bacterium]